MPAQRVYFHTPYAGWSYHSAMEAVLAHALDWRDVETLFTFCDGLFGECDLFRRGTTPEGVPHRVNTSCLFCQAQQTADFAQYRVPWTWLGTWLSRDDYGTARAFADGLPEDELLTATFRDQPVGEWAQSSAFFQFRLSRIEVTPEVAAVLRECIYGTVLTWLALQRVFDEFQPDVLVTFNGRFFSQRAAIEVANARGVRVVSHERGYRKGTALWREGGPIHTLEFFDRIWADWHDVPLTHEQLRYTSRLLADRRFGRNLNWRAFSPPPEEAAALREKLQLDDRPVVTCFTSSDDEWLTFPERREGPFPDSLDWIPATVQAARDSPRLQWVVRFHPNLTGFGTNKQALDQARALGQDLPENCRFVMPNDDVSSYTLGDLSDAVVTYGSTIGLEMAAAGKCVVAVSRGWYGRTDIVRAAQTPGDYLDTVRQAVAAPPSLRAVQAAHRFLFHLFQETAIPFPWVEETDNHRGVLTFTNTAELVPGESETLDALVGLVLDGTPLQPAPPDSARGARSLLEEHLLLRQVPALALAPDRPNNALTALLQRATDHERGGRLPAAEAGFLQAIQMQAACGEAWFGLGRCKLRQRQLNPADRALARAADLLPDEAAIWLTWLKIRAHRGLRTELTDLVTKARAAGQTHGAFDQVADQLGMPAREGSGQAG